jgi:hypothetical protein
MVLLMHVLFVGAVFMLDSTLDRRIHEEPWYNSLLILRTKFFFAFFAFSEYKFKIPC